MRIFRVKCSLADRGRRFIGTYRALKIEMASFCETLTLLYQTAMLHTVTTLYVVNGIISWYTNDKPQLPVCPHMSV